MTTSSLIAFCGPKFAGKTTAAKALPPGYMPYAFANPIRAMLRVLGVPEANLTDPALKEVPMPQFGGKSAREMMQSLGTEWGRAHVAPTLWLDRARDKITERLAAGGCVVIDDLRFPNEAAIVRELGGTVIAIDRPGFCHSEGHASEAGIPVHLVDATVTNGTDKASFEAHIHAMLANPGNGIDANDTATPPAHRRVSP